MKVHTVGRTYFNANIARMHTHNAYEMIINTDGTGTMTVGDKSFEFGEGTVVVVPPDTNHFKSSEKGFRDIYVTFSAFSVDKHIADGVFTDSADKKLEKLLFIALTIHNEGLSGSNYIISNIIKASLELLRSNCDKADLSPCVEVVKNDIIQNFANYEYTAGDGYKKTFYTNDHVCRLFKKEIGMTPVSYLNKLRIEHAKELMLTSNKLRLNEIAFMSGFANEKYFSKMFRISEGITPSQFKKSNPRN